MSKDSSVVVTRISPQFQELGARYCTEIGNPPSTKSGAVKRVYLAFCQELLASGWNLCSEAEALERMAALQGTRLGSRSEQIARGLLLDEEEE
jgi:hypothetical protein